ncbi:unnamed protein product [Didymodactylos carnosus]|uniref:Disease resistance R13L4/SHOC-2-like LRR domain-containing protein n=1 Tax=Didymodactylos carnosus TaxID=1234261 RepID=A0A814YYR7_9BILA|nr:unnamed protein product [Didymodactylos carnosus]CAF1235447.1 unnamed protein product [Didymodactylos carnosus]CAF3821994.1 unnamed protein product [Didymodactylos carnosus]CAF3997824.1 unnamed protein product [Didymodactylos carnosus]
MQQQSNDMNYHTLQMMSDEKYPSEHLLFEPLPSIVSNRDYENNNDNNIEHFLNDEDDDYMQKGHPLDGLEIKGHVKVLSPVLWSLTNIRFLIMNNNELSRLPPEIGNLTKLIHLDLSKNRLRTLPAQIGNLVHLKRLYLENNQLKNLPYELGKLNIEDIGLKNNPLSDEVLSLFARPYGTSEIMNYLREKWKEFNSFPKVSYKMSLPWNNNDDNNNNNNNSNTIMLSG